MNVQHFSRVPADLRLERGDDEVREDDAPDQELHPRLRVQLVHFVLGRTLYDEAVVACLRSSSKKVLDIGFDDFAVPLPSIFIRAPRDIK